MTKRRRFSPEFKKQAVEMVENGRPVPEVALELEFEPSCLYSWMRQAHPSANPFGTSESQAPTAASDSDELLTLRRENVILRRENDILKKAAIILGTDPSFRTGK